MLFCITPCIELLLYVACNILGAEQLGQHPSQTDQYLSIVNPMVPLT